MNQYEKLNKQIKDLKNKLITILVTVMLLISALSFIGAKQLQTRFEEMNKNIITNNENQLLIIENQTLIINRFDSLKAKSKYIR